MDESRAAELMEKITDQGDLMAASELLLETLKEQADRMEHDLHTVRDLLSCLRTVITIKGLRNGQRG